MAKTVKPQQKGRLVLKSRLNVIIAEMEQKQERRIKDEDVFKETNISRPTIRKYRDLKPIERVDASVITALCEWAGVGVGDILYVEREG
jgi:DNA-binding Xre family transcriptional regulator